jgi:hypothetical protein
MSHPYPYPYPVRPELQHPLPVSNQHVYTNRIDAAIAEERYQVPTDQFGETGIYRLEVNDCRPKAGEHWVKPDLYYEATGKEPPPDYHGNDWDLERHRHRGPLHNPLLSSTQRSNADMSPSKNGGNFEPLLPEFSESYVSVPVARGHLRGGHGELYDAQDFDRRNRRDVDVRSSHHDVHRGHRHMEVEENGHRHMEYEQNGHRDIDYKRNVHRDYDVNRNGQKEFEFDRDGPVRGQSHRDREGERNRRHFDGDQYHRQTEHENSPVSTNFHDHVNGDSFGTYYKKLSPEQRRKQMVAQKEALLREQHRLRKILQEHEGMLREKQVRSGFLGTGDSGFLGTGDSGFLGTGDSGFLGMGDSAINGFLGTCDSGFLGTDDNGLQCCQLCKRSLIQTLIQSWHGHHSGCLKGLPPQRHTVDPLY